VVARGSILPCSFEQTSDVVSLGAVAIDDEAKIGGAAYVVSNVESASHGSVQPTKG
jgi:hypothetical protein